MLLYYIVQVTQALLYYTRIRRFFFYMPNITIINPDLEQVSDAFRISEKHFGWAELSRFSQNTMSKLLTHLHCDW